jgi:superfamily I DNA/RNA helicase
VSVSGSGLGLHYSYRFYDDYRRLSTMVARKVTDALGLVRDHGPYHPSLHTRKIAGNPDGRMRFMNVDDQFRIVAVLEGSDILFELVGNHDDTLKRGAKHTLREYEERRSIDPESFVRPRGMRAAVIEAADAPTLFEDQPPSLQEILAEPEKIADLIVGDLFGALDGYRDGSIEDWMVFLSPLQHRAIQRAMNGPARVTGGPGTGKTVVALHRAVEFARSAPKGRRVLMTSFVRNIPETLDGLFERLAPDVHDKVAFRHIHDLALDMLHHRDVPLDADWIASKRRFDRVHQSEGESARALMRAGFDRDYIWQEVTRVIEGRGVETLDAYLSIQRHGRKRPMQSETRRHVWSVYEAYRSACDAQVPPLADPEWVLKLALEAVRREPTGSKYHAIVVDEAQDITETGLRFLLELLDHGAAGRILLVGDQSQRIYAGGFRLSDAGIDVRGRSTALRICYRSTDEIMQLVAALGRDLSSEDFGDDGLRSLAASTVRRGEPPTINAFASGDEETAWLVGELRHDEDLDSVAILASTNARVDDWVARLKIADVPHVRLTAYQGRPIPGVKIGTYARAKGLEFKRVFLPGLGDDRFPWGDRNDLDSVLLQGSMLYVGMSRARDRLEISYVGRPSAFLLAAESPRTATP